MLIFVFILASSLLLFISRSSTKPLIGKWWINFFVLWWTVAFCISTTNPFGLYPVSSESYFILSFFVLSYVLGYVIGLSKTCPPPPTSYSILSDFKSLSTSRLFLIAQISYISILLAYLTRYQTYILGAGAIDARAARFEIGMVFQSTAEAVLFEYLIGGSIWLFKFMAAFGAAYRSSRNLSWILSMIACALYMGFGAGRNIIIETVLLFFFFSAIKKLTGASDKTNISTSTLLSITIGAYALFIYATYVRMFDDALTFERFILANTTIWDQIIIYCVGSFRAFDYAHSNFQEIIGFNYGALTLNGLNEIISHGLTFLGFETRYYSNHWAELLASPIYISNTQLHNALYTAAFNFYFDFGLAGVVFNGFIFGFLCAKSLISFFKNRNLSSLFTLALLFTFSILTCLTWKLSSGPALFALAFGLLRIQMTKKRHLRTEIKKNASTD